MPLLSLKSVSFAYDDTPIISAVSLDIAASEAVAVMGPSGSGKSTLCRIIAGLQAPDEGNCELDGSPINGVQRGVFLGFQDYDAFPWYTVRENVSLAMTGGDPTKLADSSIGDILAAVGLGDSADKFPRELSGGMRKRLALARCLATKARLIILDEPFASLDSRSRRDLQMITRKMVEDGGRSLLLCTHDPYEAAFLSDRVIVCSGRPLSVQECIEVKRTQGASVTESQLLTERAAHDINQALIGAPGTAENQVSY